MDMVLAVH